MQVSLRYVFIALAILLIGGVSYVAYAQMHGGFTKQPVACTAEAKMCPDGSAVGRTGPNCEFAECPSETATTTAGGVGAHCGGFIQNAPTCASGYHCQLKVNMPDTGGTCVADTTSGTLAIGEQATINGTTIGVLGLTEDSRCPADVQCIQAGTVRVRTAIDSYNRDFTFTLGVPQTVNGATITLTAVVPAQKNSKVTVAPTDYRFTFLVQK